jgi:glycosyltransferase involved in cell wall biosynthesis
VVIDDASNDNSLAIISPYLAQYHHIKLYQNSRNEGVGYTKKRCIDEAKGEILGFVDPDDTITPDAVRKMIEAHQAHQQAALIYSNYYECNEHLQITGEYKSAQVINGDHYFFNDDGNIGPFSAFKKKCYEKTSGLNATLKRAIDQDLYLKLYDTGDCTHLPKILYYYRLHDHGIATSAQTDLAYYWFWLVKILRAQEKGINLEHQFNNTFIRRKRIWYLIPLDQKIRKSFVFKVLRKWLK